MFCGTTTVVVPLLGGMTTVVARAGGGSLLTQPASNAPRISKLDTTFIFVSSFKRTWSFEQGIIEPSLSVRYGLTGRVSRAYPACVCRRASYTPEAGLWMLRTIFRTIVRGRNGTMRTVR